MITRLFLVVILGGYLLTVLSLFIELFIRKAFDTKTPPADASMASLPWGKP